MDFKTFDKYQQELFAECAKMSSTKGREYSHSQDRFANFNRLAEGLNLPNIQIAWVYAMKHKDSIESYLRDGYKGTEPIRGRIVDFITYLTLIAGMIQEKEANNKGFKFYFPTGQQPFEYDPTKPTEDYNNSKLIHTDL